MQVFVEKACKAPFVIRPSHAQPVNPRIKRLAALLVKPCGDRLVDHFAGVDAGAAFLLPIHIGA